MAALAGVCAYVVCNQNEQRLGLVSRLRSLGAQIAPRLGREVSHVVFSRIAVPTPEQKTKEDIELRTLFDRARKADCHAIFVTPLWVQSSVDLGRRAMEHHFMLSKPLEPLLLPPSKSPLTAGLLGRPKRRADAVTAQAGRAARKVQEVAGLDLDDITFSSSQQLQHEPAAGDNAGDGGGAGAAGKQKKRRASSLMKRLQAQRAQQGSVSPAPVAAVSGAQQPQGMQQQQQEEEEEEPRQQQQEEEQERICEDEEDGLGGENAAPVVAVAGPPLNAAMASGKANKGPLGPAARSPLGGLSALGDISNRSSGAGGENALGGAAAAGPSMMRSPLQLQPSRPSPQQQQQQQQAPDSRQAWGGFATPAGGRRTPSTAAGGWPTAGGPQARGSSATPATAVGALPPPVPGPRQPLATPASAMPATPASAARRGSAAAAAAANQQGTTPAAAASAGHKRFSPLQLTPSVRVPGSAGGPRAPGSAAVVSDRPSTGLTVAAALSTLRKTGGPGSSRRPGAGPRRSGSTGSGGRPSLSAGTPSVGWPAQGPQAAAAAEWQSGIAAADQEGSPDAVLIGSPLPAALATAAAAADAVNGGARSPRPEASSGGAFSFGAVRPAAPAAGGSAWGEQEQAQEQAEEEEGETPQLTQKKRQRTGAGCSGGGSGGAETAAGSRSPGGWTGRGRHATPVLLFSGGGGGAASRRGASATPAELPSAAAGGCADLAAEEAPAGADDEMLPASPLSALVLPPIEDAGADEAPADPFASKAAGMPVPSPRRRTAASPAPSPRRRGAGQTPGPAPRRSPRLSPPPTAVIEAVAPGAVARDTPGDKQQAAGTPGFGAGPPGTVSTAQRSSRVHVERRGAAAADGTPATIGRPSGATATDAGTPATGPASAAARRGSVLGPSGLRGLGLGLAPPVMSIRTPRLKQLPCADSVCAAAVQDPEAGQQVPEVREVTGDGDEGQLEGQEPEAGMADEQPEEMDQFDQEQQPPPEAEDPSQQQQRPKATKPKQRAAAATRVPARQPASKRMRAAAPAAATKAKPAAKAKAAAPAAAAAAAAAAALAGGRPLSGKRTGPMLLAWSSVEAAVADIARSAAQRLPGGARVCAEGHEDGMTHLIVGGERRTLKALLAMANGAHILTPEWLTASLEAGRWLPEGDFVAPVRFAAVAAAARAARGPGAAPRARPLEGRMVTVHVLPRGAGAAAQGAAGALGGAGGGAAGHRVAMQRLVRALGGRVCGPRAADLCVVCGGSGSAAAPGAVPRELPPGARAVSEEWLLRVAETHTVPE